MRILLAGGSGLIGRALTARLLEDGHNIWVLTRKPGSDNLSTIQHSGLEWVGWDAKTTSGWGHLVGEADVIINLAGANIGEKRWSSQRKHILRTSRVAPGQALLAAIRQSPHRPEVLLQIAGVGYYGPHGDELLDEQSPAGSDFLASVAKDWENSTQAVQEMGVRHVIMRTGVVLSREGGVLDPFLLQHSMFAGGPLGSGKQWISWIHFMDLIECCLFFIYQPETQGVYNVTSPEPVTNAEFGKTLARILHRPYWAPAPAFVLRLVLGEMSTLVLDGQRVLPRRLVEKGFQFRFGNLHSALENLLQKNL